MTTPSAKPKAHIEKFQHLLRELFQFDSTDLDFGIYRIMNYKRDVIEKFIAEDLPKAISDDLKRGVLAEQDRAATELAEIEQQVKDNIGENAIDDNGELLRDYRNTRVGKKYLDAKDRLSNGRSREAVEIDIFNHLYAFFSSYYEDGDFISKRRYAKRQQYAIPYNGEEVHLHWANRDQYYVKTGEHFRDYDWKAPNGIAVHFRIKAADVEQNNVKGDKRFFLPLVAKTEWDAKARAITLPFEYRPLTEREKRDYGTKNQQEKIIDAAVGAIPEQIGVGAEALPALTGERHRNGKDESVCHLEHHLIQYTRRNTSDFFIHKDLEGFLSRELDFYLKNEVLNLDEMTVAGENMTKGWFQMLRLIKAVGNRIIAFLAQIENFQKMLWEKRKFITETQYCITVGNIDEGFYPAIAACEAQWAKWKALFHIDEDAINLFNSGQDTQGKRIAFVQAHPTLVLDTRYFDADFTDHLLASFDDLDGMTDGLLIHGDNWQALNLLREKYAEEVKCIYIDPPYNTSASEIIYKNGYKHSSWLSLMENRIVAAKHLLHQNAAWVMAIDDTEMVGLSQLIDSVFTAYDRNMVVVNHHPAGSGLEGTNVSSTHEYAIFMTPTGVKILRGRKKETGVSEIGFVRTGTATSNLRSGRPNSFYAVLVDPVTSKIVGAESPPTGASYPRDNTQDGFVRIYPVSADGTERVWRRSYKTIHACIEKGEVICKNGRSIYLITDQTGKRRPLFSNWTDRKYNAGAHGTNLLKQLFGDGDTFSYPKSIHTVRDCVDACIHSFDDATVLDYFAGSGTTGHAVINLNREDGGRRAFILVEMGEYFDTVLLPRIEKVTFTPEWRDGKPKRMATLDEAERSPRIVKYLCVENYEDALNNIAFDEVVGQLKLEEQLDDYLIKYMLQWETKDSATLLNVAKIASPFTYRLRVQTNGETQERTADIPETFNYLLGLNVRTRRVYEDEGRRYVVYRGETRDAPGREVAVIWRKTEGWERADFDRDRQFIADQGLADGVAVVYVNGDSCIPGAIAIEPMFKARMFAEVAT